MKRKYVTNEFIRSLRPCYDPAEIGIPDNEKLTVKQWILKYRGKVQQKKDVIWLICSPRFMTNRDLRLFAVWCARETLKFVEKPDIRSVNAINVAERYANGKATKKELAAARAVAWVAAWVAARAVARAVAWDAAWVAARVAARAAARAAARDAAWVAARAVAWDAARDAARDAQIDKLLTYF